VFNGRCHPIILSSHRQQWEFAGSLLESFQISLASYDSLKLLVDRLTQNTDSALLPPSPLLPPSTPSSAAAYSIVNRCRRHRPHQVIVAAFFAFKPPPSPSSCCHHRAIATDTAVKSPPPPSSHRRRCQAAVKLLPQRCLLLGRQILLIWRQRLVRSWVFLGSSSSLGELHHIPSLVVLAIPSGTVSGS
jgi:hypothetical protein